jgi:hypothetical protein
VESMIDTVGSQNECCSDGALAIPSGSGWLISQARR